MKLQYIYCLFFILLFSCSKKNEKESAEFFNRANYHFKKNEIEKALTFYNESIEKTPDFADAYNNRGVLYEKQGELDLAIKDYKKAVEIDSKFYEAKLNLARLNSEMGFSSESKMIFDELAIVMKDSSSYYNYKGQNDVRMNNFADAAFNFDKSISLKKDNFEALTNRGYLSYLQKKYDLAENDFLQALKSNSKFGFALNNLGLVFEKKGNFKEALNFAKQAYEIEPNNPLFINNYVYALLIQGDLNKEIILELIDKSINIDANNSYGLRNKGIFLYKNNRNKEALEFMQNAEKQDPSTEYIYYFLGLTSRKLNDVKLSCSYFETGVKLKDGKSLSEFSKCK